MFRDVFLMVCLVVAGCDNSTTVTNTNGDGTITVCTTSTALDASDGGNTDPPGVVVTCDDHLPCTVDIQCTPCSAVPEELRIKATCTNDAALDPFCFAAMDSMFGELVYTGCVHFIQDPTPAGTIDACFPVQFPDDPGSIVHPGVCNAFGICVENP